MTKNDRTMQHRVTSRSRIAALAVFGLWVGCSGSAGEDADGGSSESDSDSDGDADSDGDSDSDSDADTDGDGDTDSDSLSDGESDVCAGTDKGTDTDTGTGIDATVEDVRFTIEYQRADELNPDAPGTIYIVTWSVNLPSVENAVIRFGPDSGCAMTAPVDLSEEGYRTLLLGMKPSSEYHFQIVATSGGIDYASPDTAVETGPPTDLLTVSDFTVVDEDGREPGFIVLINGWVVGIIDPDGAVVWWYRSTQAGLFAARMSYDAKNMWMVTRLNGSGGNATGPMERVTMDTLETQVYEETSASHDLIPVAGDTMAFLNYAGGAGCSDAVVEIDNSGATTEVFDASDHLGNCHLNALGYNDEESMYTVSDRATTVYVFDRHGDLAWRLSDLVSNNTYGGAQHGHHLLDDSLLIFANDASANASLAIEYRSSDGEKIFSYNGGRHSGTLGDVQRLPGGNTLVTYSNSGVIHEVDPEGNRVLEIHTGEQGYTSWRPSLYGPPSDLQI